jgi:UDP-N-acetylglucosamine diphosphorylase/glucosamine-1-phosphate N-acetyltransferase
MKLYLFDDRATDAWHPFQLTRPASELLFGALLLRQRLERFAGRPATSVLTRPWLSGFEEPGGPAASPRKALPADEERLLLSSRFVPSSEARFEGRGGDPMLLVTRDEVVGCYVPAGTPGPGPEWLEVPDDSTGVGGWKARRIDGALLDSVWRLVAENPGRLVADLAREAASRGGVELLPEGTWKLGSHPVMLGAGVTIEPGAVFDAREGPIKLADDVEVRAGCRLGGPLYVGPSTRLLGGDIGSSSIGPVCRVRGEVEDTVVLGYTNKAHDGFLGHSCLGRWVNLGALTTNSDLKNNYGPVRLGGPDGPIETGLTKLGCLLGDHVKTAIGTRINTGTVIGAGSNVFGEALPPRWVHPFSWGSGEDAQPYALDRFLAVARRVFERRDVEFGDRTAEWLTACWTVADRDRSR